MNLGKRRMTRTRPWSLATTHRWVDWACSFSGLMPRKSHIGLIPLARIKTRIAGSAVGFSPTDHGRENVFPVRRQVWVYACSKKRALREWLWASKKQPTSRKLFGTDDVIVPGATAVQAQHPTDAKVPKPQSRAYPGWATFSATAAKIEVRPKDEKRI